VNKILNDFVLACKPKYVEVKGEFNIRGGMKTIVEAKYQKEK
jgi:7-cyano-7-deazaguanine reductase